MSILHYHDTSPTDTYTLSLHDALPISGDKVHSGTAATWEQKPAVQTRVKQCLGGSITPWGSNFDPNRHFPPSDRKSTRLNSSHRCISYAVFCLKKKKIYHNRNNHIRH